MKASLARVYRRRMANPYQPPSAPIDAAPPPDPPSIGYLIGGLVQLVGGAMSIVFGLVTEWQAGLYWGLFIAFFGLLAVIKYQARIRRARSG